MTDDDLLAVLAATVDAVRGALDAVDDWRPTTERPSQYAIDLAADAAALPVLLDAGLGVLSEESGRHHPERPVTVVIDPVDGSTNASRRLPWYACSLCAVDDDGPRAALVVNLATGERGVTSRSAPGAGWARNTTSTRRASGSTTTAGSPSSSTSRPTSSTASRRAPTSASSPRSSRPPGRPHRRR